jgi:hypothetical protein
MKTLIALTLILLTQSVLSASLYAPDGSYLGELGGAKWAYNSTSNPYGPHGSPNARYSINNPRGLYGSRSSSQSPNNPNLVTNPLIEDPIQELNLPE